MAYVSKDTNTFMYIHMCPEIECVSQVFLEIPTVALKYSSDPHAL